MKEHSDLRFGQWVRATWAGWILGIPLIVALALAGEAAGIGGAQVFVGAGMGMGIGFMQRRAMKGVLHQSGPWLWSCVVGLAVPFLVTDVAKAVGWNLRYSLHASVAFGGLIVGAWQALILRQRFRKTGSWVVASALGWTLAGGRQRSRTPCNGRGYCEGHGRCRLSGDYLGGWARARSGHAMSLIWMLRREPAALDSRAIVGDVLKQYPQA